LKDATISKLPATIPKAAAINSKPDATISKPNATKSKYISQCYQSFSRYEPKADYLSRPLTSSLRSFVGRDFHPDADHITDSDFRKDEVIADGVLL
jgi:hypothetical protein